MTKPGYKKKPSQYPPCAFHTIRTIQGLSSFVVAAVMFYFIYRLKHDNLYVPWMFFFLQGAALATLLTLTVSMILKCCWSLSPLLNGLVNGLLFLIWAAGLGLLINAMRATILRQCTVDYWGDQTGVYVCISYKLLLAFATTGTLSTLSACILDFQTKRRETSRGKYEQANLGKVEHQQTGYERVRE